jgi:hypothetical protein
MSTPTFRGWRFLQNFKVFRGIGSSESTRFPGGLVLRNSGKIRHPQNVGFDEIHEMSFSGALNLWRFGIVNLRSPKVANCHTCFSKENQVQTYMHARIKFHAHSDIKVYTETVSHKKNKDYQRFTLNPGNEGTKLHKQSTGGCVRLELATSSQDFRVASSFWATLFIARVSTCRTQQVWEKYECKGFIVDCLKAFKQF